MSYRFGPDDEGKRVVTADGSVVGTVHHVSGGDAYVRPKPGLLEGCGSWIGGTWSDAASYPLDDRFVAKVGERDVRLRTTEQPRPEVPSR